MSFKRILHLLVILAIVLVGININVPTAKAEDVTLVIESWRTGDEAVWDKIIADFEAKNPGIKVKFQPTNPPDYNAALNAKLKSGTAGDLITCLLFDVGELL